MKYVAIAAHRSEYPAPITFARGALLSIGQRYEGDEHWEDWYLCGCHGQEPGWVPAQVIERLGVDRGRALEAYSAHELDIDPGQQLEGLRPLNGWLWCRRVANGELGWVPMAKLRLLG
ncbi:MULTISPECIES: SH3 domain-containing protein [unclassified Pseudomonas]|uniref:SH3 domain-containing protein n=1 Tax=unclassified Pseudomonas TaxID=196821 RepID=UPI002449DB61|nr:MULTISPECIES: SH3 domain-containing protein [unclassified Pseudomonas]MDH0303658.1 SH3 domain-containing protein [Pseudomonas sp. GD04091]MDH1986724.1 SH3 domain-containing protein [Pseudomonas sp. GD03689]